MKHLSEQEMELLRSTVTAARAVELLVVLGHPISLRDLGAARRDGRIKSITVGDGPPRYDPIDLERFAHEAIMRSQR